MDPAVKRKRIVDEVFSATGAKMDPEDPLVTAALYYSYELSNASKGVASEIQGATAELRASMQLLQGANAAVIAERKKLMQDIEAHVTKCVKLVSKGQSNVQDFSRIPVWYAVAGAVAGALALSTALLVGVERNSALAEDAAVGRAFARALPTMDPKLKQQLMEHLHKPAH